MTLDQFLDKWKATPVRTRGLALIAALTLLLVGMAAIEHTKRMTGEEIILAARPVDPRDILRGAYVAIDYDVETIQLSMIEHADDFVSLGPGPDIPVWLTLKPNEFGTWSVARVLKNRPPTLEQGEVALQAQWINRYAFTPPPVESPAPAQNEETKIDETPPDETKKAEQPQFMDMRVDIGADRYFANEARAKQLENAIRDGDFQVVLSVGRDGKPAIKGLVLNGQREDETFF